MAGLSFRNALLLAKIETVEGVDSVPTEAADAILANQITVTPQPDIVVSQEFSGSLDLGAPIIGGTPMQIAIQVYLKGSGIVATPPEYAPLLRACGWDETINPGTDVTYGLVSQNIPSITIYAFRDELLWQFTGCRGNLQGTLTTRQLGVLDMTFMGRFQAKLDLTAGPATFDAVRPPVWQNGAFTINAVATAVQQLTWNFNNTIALPNNPNDPEGFNAPCVTARDIQGSMNPLESLVATRNIFADFRAGTRRTLLARLGTVAGNIATVTIPRAIYRGETQGDRDNLLFVDVPFTAESIDDGVELVFT